MWFPLALGEALVSSFGFPINKYQVRTVSPIALLYVNQIFSVLCMFVAILFLGGIPRVTSNFFLFMFCSSLLDAVAFFCAYWSVKYTQISLLSPLGALTPIAATIFGFIFLHEVPTPLKLLGVLTIVAGVYLLNVASIRHGFFKPFTKLFSDKGVKLYMVQVMIFGITPIFQKQAIFQITPSMPLFAALIGNCFVTLYYTFFALKIVNRERKAIVKNGWLFLILGVTNTLSQLAAYMVFSMTHVGYATAIFSLSSLFIVLYGGLFLKESNLGERILGALVIIGGVVLLAL